jgi:hypothetical protein
MQKHSNESKKLHVKYENLVICSVSSVTMSSFKLLGCVVDALSSVDLLGSPRSNGEVYYANEL